MIDILLIVIVFYFARLNSLRAQAKGQNILVWGLITFVAFFTFQTIGSVAAVMLFYKGPMEFAALQNYVKNMPPITVFFIFFCGFGGYLLVKFILDRMPNKPQANKQ